MESGFTMREAPAPNFWKRQWIAARAYFVGQDPTFWTALTPALLLAALLYVRSPASNYIFDEQEALLANPYVNGEGLGFLDVFRRDFWGLPPTRSIGSYRPIPNVIWRGLWNVHQHPWLLHWVNVVFHAVNGAVLAGFVLAVTGRRALGWLAGGVFLISAVITEAVTGVVGIADVLGGLGVLLMVSALRWNLALMPLGVFSAGCFGLLCKESVLIGVPLVPWVALATAPLLHRHRPWRAARTLGALLASVGALVAYTYFRRHFFPIDLPASLEQPLPESEPLVRRAMHTFLAWFQQPKLPQDPINNPLIDADFPHRVSGALRVYFRGLGQAVFPWTLSGDYSFAQEPIPDRLFTAESVAGGVLLGGPPLAGIALWVRGLLLERKRPSDEAGRAEWAARLGGIVLLASGMVWVPLAYFPHSNIPMLLPTVRAERFWYLPVVGLALVLAPLLARLARHGRVGVALVAVFFGFQAVRTRMHALDYNTDLTFWRATAKAAPMSAKAHLNYGVMLGARGKLEERLIENRRALELAPHWPMAHVYYGDTLCRLHRADEAWPHFIRGFEMGPNDLNLIALGLQCLWDEKKIESHEEELLAAADEHPGTWLAYLGKDILYNGEEHGGVQKKYRPRGYDEGPKNKPE